MVTIPNQYQVTATDITAQLAEKALVAYGKSCQEFGAELIAWVHATNEAKNLNAEQFTAILQDQTLAAVERCLWNGSIKTAKALVQGMQTGLFSPEEKDAVIAKIDAFLTLHGKL